MASAAAVGFLFIAIIISAEGFSGISPRIHHVSEWGSRPRAAVSSLVDIPTTCVLSQGNVEFPKIRTPLEEPVDGESPDQDDDHDFNMNLGRAMDYLAHDVPLMFSAPPRLEIFTSNVVLKDPIGELLHGRRLYGALHTSLRVLGAITAIKPRVGVSSICYSKTKKVVELKWTMAASAPFIGESTAVKLSAVSLYSVNPEGLIFEHAIDNRIKRDLWEYSHSWMGMLTGDRPPPLT